ncbi:MAG: YfcE family phosphodiesterase [Erysipelotrichia bacterium]|nr:YfcE family phosphodiesterase [Erysipelotrichia bacterium]
MKIVVMSDSHGNDKNVIKVINENSDADYFYHLGDLCSPNFSHPKMTVIKGNNDYADYPTKIVVRFDRIKIFMLHSDKIYFNRLEAMKNLAKKENCQIVLYGHTHIPADDTIDGIRLLNPGSLSMNRDFSKLSYLILEIDENNYK